MYAVCTRAYNYADLSWSDFERVLQMLAGVYESDEAIDLKPRLQWDRLGNVISVDSYGKQLVYSNSGTIPNRGYYKVYLGNNGPLLGELDEEFVYERRLGDRFLLGTSVWRIEEVRQDRVVVSKPTGQGTNLPFWKGETVSRSFAFGKRLGGFLREAESHLVSAESFHTWLKAKLQVEDKHVAQTLYVLLNEQTRSTGKLPTDRCLVQEEFLGEMNDWHICLHSPFGTKLHTLLALLISEQIQSEPGLKIEAFPTDNGILLHAPGGAKPPQIDWASLLSPDLRDKIAQLISTTSLFGITFRHCAQRSLVMALLTYGKKRTPLWLSRLKASDLLQVVSHHQDFPLVMETYREILQDHFSIGDLEDFLSHILRGEIDVHRVQTQTPSPFAYEHLFNFVATQMYSDGTPAAQPKRLFGLETSTLQEIFGKEGLSPLIRDDAVRQVEIRLQGRDALIYRPTLERAQYWLERVGDTTWEEVEENFPDNLPEITQLVQELLDQERAYKSGDDHIVATLHSRDYLALERRNHTSKSKSRSEALRSIIVRYLRCHGPFSAETLAERYQIRQDAITEILVQLEKEGLLVRGDFLGQQDSRHWCSPQVLREIHALSLSKGRSDVATADHNQYATFLVQWQDVKNKNSAKGTDIPEEPSAQLHKILHQLREMWLPAAKLESLLLPARWHSYSAPHLDQILGSGLISWRAKQIGKELFIRFEPGFPASDQVAIPTWVDCPVYSEDFLSGVQLSPSAERLVQTLQRQGALNLFQLSTVLEQSVSRVWSDLAELMVSGIVSNDTLGPIRLLAKWERHRQRKMHFVVESPVLGQMGRFFILPQRRERSAAAQVQTLLDRYGIATREIAMAEGLIWGDLYPIFDYLEHIGEVRRGYFVDGLSGIQFARQDAVARLNQTITSSDQWWVLAKEDPAYPCQSSNAQVEAGSLILFRAGKPVISAKKRKLALTILDKLSNTDLEHGLLFLLQSLYPLYPDEKIVISEVNNIAVTECQELPILKRLGFELAYRVAVLWPSERK
jgi:ATP-dependent Lhr-like helicase